MEKRKYLTEEQQRHCLSLGMTMALKALNPNRRHETAQAFIDYVEGIIEEVITKLTDQKDG